MDIPICGQIFNFDRHFLDVHLPSLVGQNPIQCFLHKGPRLARTGWQRKGGNMCFYAIAESNKIDMEQNGNLGIRRKNITCSMPQTYVSPFGGS